ncbi:platelet-activating factor acetylhydrolase-like isoform X2 [Patiria miniata]|nr:platelet-activating factor acetylhydrolase-like isoform X2 [Patiria miniata]
MRLFYPADTPKESALNDNSACPTWLPSKEYATGFVAYAGLQQRSARLLASVLNYFTGRIKIPAVENAPLAKSDAPFPVLIFSHGLSSCRTTYSSICVEMASQGFVVAAVEHRDRSACTTYVIKNVTTDDSDSGAPSSDTVREWIPILLMKKDEFEIRNNQLNTRAAECSRALDLLLQMNNGEPVVNALNDEFDGSMFQGKLDSDKVAICGHSFGGATTLLTLSKDKRFKCCVALDPWQFPIDKTTYVDIDQPVLLINTEKFHWPANVTPMIRLVPDLNEPTEDRRMITIRGTVHSSQCDFATLFRPSMARFMHFAGSLDPVLAMELNLHATLAFLSSKLGLPYNPDYDRILRGDNEHVLIGTNVKLDPEKVLDIKASL